MSIRQTKYKAQPIPTRIRYEGNVEQAKTLLGYAKKQFAKRLEIDGANRYNKHLIANRRWPTIESNLGETIDMQMIQGVSFITIYAPSDGTEKKTTKRTACYCDCAITAGSVIYSPARAEEKPDEWLPYSGTQYNVSVCREDHFGQLKELFATDFFPHRDEEPELVDDVLVATRKADNIYAVTSEKEIYVYNPKTESKEPIHKRMPDIVACSWKTLLLTSIEPTDEHLKLETIYGEEF